MADVSFTVDSIEKALRQCETQSQRDNAFCIEARGRTIAWAKKGKN